MAPDGSEVRILLSLAGGSLAHFRLAAGQVARAVSHRTVEEIWFVTAGSGDIWRSQNGHEQVVGLAPGVSVTIPRGTAFQFRAAPHAALEIVSITMPPWPGDDEAVLVDGPWVPAI
jgi:mannose-6-phosphate isomerase-like protein (cupin superfamily)